MTESGKVHSNFTLNIIAFFQETFKHISVILPDSFFQVHLIPDFHSAHIQYALFHLFICAVCINYRLNLLHKGIIVVLVINSAEHWFAYNIAISVNKYSCWKGHDF